MFKELKPAIINSLGQIKIVNFLNLLIYFLPFSIFYFRDLEFIKFPYAYLTFLIFALISISDFKRILFKFNLKLLILFLLSLFLLTVSFLINDNYSYSTYVGISIRLVVIFISTNLIIDIKSLHRCLMNSIPLYLIPVVFTEKFNFLNLNDFASVNSNVLGATFTSILLLIFVLKKRLSLKIQLINYIFIIFSSLMIFIIAESRGVLVSLFLSILIINSLQA